MILYPKITLGVKPENMLEGLHGIKIAGFSYSEPTRTIRLQKELADLLGMKMADFLCWRDLPVPGAKLAHLGVMARAFIGTLMNGSELPWGMVTELAKAMDTSRQTIYTIAERIREGVFVRPNGRPSKEEKSVEPLNSPQYPTVIVTPNRIKRTVLTNLLPGGMAIRSQQENLQVALGIPRSQGWISELILEVGERAGSKLDEIDLSPLGQVTTARDELYFNDNVFLINVEPIHYVIVGAYVEEQCDSETWSIALQLDHHTRGLEIVGLSEDGAKMYPASVKKAELSIQVQKDVWHIIKNTRQAVRDIERMALRAMTRADQIQKKIAKDGTQNNEEELKKWLNAEENADQLFCLSEQVSNLYGHLCDALELVDWRSGEIRDRETNEWLLNEVIQELDMLEHPRIRKLVTYLEGQKKEMLTFLDWLEVNLSLWERKLEQHFQREDDRKFFRASVARAWRLNRALENGHKSFANEAKFAKDLIAELLLDDPKAHQLAEALFNILEGVIRTSCAAETINSILRPYLTMKRSFQSRKTAQAWLNIFSLWFNMHPLKRSKRRHGKEPMSPYQFAGVQVFTDDGHQTLDWLEAIGYPAK